MQVRSLSQEDPLEKEMSTHSSILSWRIPLTEEPSGLHTVHGRVRHNLTTDYPGYPRYNWSLIAAPAPWPVNA